MVGKGTDTDCSQNRPVGVSLCMPVLPAVLAYRQDNWGLVNKHTTLEGTDG